jgi:6-phosphogluconolactonase
MKPRFWKQTDKNFIPNFTKMKYILIITILIVSGFTTMTRASTAKEYIYVGTYNEDGQPGIFVYEFDRKNGSMSLVQEVGGMGSPSYLEIHPSGNYLYSVNRSSVTPDKKWGSVSSYKIDPEKGTLSHLNDQPSQGSESCHISIDSKGRLVFVSNYSTGNLSVFPVLEDGSLEACSDIEQHTGSSINQQRQKSPHVHQSIVSPDNSFLYVSDLGIDLVKAYSIDYNKNSVTGIPASDGLVDKGSGPRHSTIEKNQKFAYVINELASTVTAFKIEAGNGRLVPIQTISTIPEDFKEVNYCADIHIDPSGKYLYGSNRGHNSLAIFKIDRDTGKLETKGFQSTSGEWPRNFLIDPKGEFVFVANQNTNNIVIFRRNADSGELSKIEKEIIVPKPVCLKILQID